MAKIITCTGSDSLAGIDVNDNLTTVLELHVTSSSACGVLCGAGAERTYAARLPGVGRQAGVQELRGDALQGHAAVQAHAHKLHHLLVAHHIPHPIARQHKESILRAQLHLHKHVRACLQELASVWARQDRNRTRSACRSYVAAGKDSCFRGQWITP